MTKAQLLAVGSTAELESGGEQGLLTFEFPKHMEHPAGRVNLTAAYLLEYWASKGTIPRYDGVIDGLLAGAAEIFKVAKPVRSNAKLADTTQPPAPSNRGGFSFSRGEICKLLHEVCPGWCNGTGSAADQAVSAIRAMAKAR